MLSRAFPGPVDDLGPPRSKGSATHDCVCGVAWLSSTKASRCFYCGRFGRLKPSMAWAFVPQDPPIPMGPMRPVDPMALAYGGFPS